MQIASYNLHEVSVMFSGKQWRQLHEMSNPVFWDIQEKYYRLLNKPREFSTLINSAQSQKD